MNMRRTVVLLAPVSILGIFATSLLGLERLAFRDVSYFYTPLYEYVDSRMREQWLPTWNPLDQTGMPLLGESTTAVLYPPRIMIYALPLSATTAMAWYVVSHLLLAAWTSYRAARWSSASPIAAAIASIVYPLSGTVLYYYCNPAFLAGAAWLPLVLGSLVSAHELSATRRIVIASTAMAMMVLAGDPQTALHGLLLALLVWTGRTLLRRDPGTPMSVLLVSPIVAALLAAPQLAASLSWSQQSDRVAIEVEQTWWQAPVVGGKRHQAFQYSLPPWHGLELATPNAFGSLLPIHQRISRRLPGDGRVWTPSIYMSLLTLIAILSRLTRCRSGGLDAWMAITIVSFWLAAGHFGLVWVIQSGTGWLSGVDSSIGGPYWLLYQFLPGYDAFRYPAKWLGPFALGAAIVTATQVDRWMRGSSSDPRGIWITGAGLSVACVVGWFTWLNPSWLIDPGTTKPHDEFWGPLRISSALSEIALSLLHSGFIWVGILILFWVANRKRLSATTIGSALLMITLIDVTVAGSRLVNTVSVVQERQILREFGEPLERTVPRHRADAASNARWMRTQSDGGWPRVWRDTSNPARLMEVEISQRVAWYGRWHLADREPVFNSMVSLQSRRVALFWRGAKEITQSLSNEQSASFWRSMRDWLSISNIRHMTDQAVEPTQERETAIQVVEHHVREVKSPPAALQVHWDWVQHNSAPSDAKAMAERLREIWLAAHYVPHVHSAQPADVTTALRGDAEIVAREDLSSTECAVFDIELSQPALLTRAVLQDGHWKAEYRSGDASPWQNVNVEVVDGLIQGVVMPAGHWTLRFRYHPWWLNGTLVLAVISWCIVGVTARRSCSA
jgi:hypothetical protein